MTKREATQAAQLATAQSIWDPQDENKAQQAKSLREFADNMPDDGSMAQEPKPISVW